AGRVGLGTSTPAYLLSLQSNISNQTTPMISLDSTGGQSVIDFRTNSVQKGLVRADNSGNLVLSPGGGDTYIGYTDLAAVSNINFLNGAVYFASSGNVGIGTTSPYARLSVAGDVVAARYVATTTLASIFPYASTTGISASGTGFFGNLFATG